ncbi:MAG TPA: beta-ketoacyl-ACP synthase II [Mycobacteriales bacterium]|jgi:3-oxoacyl-[acyl-carrier-protein] synthase II|nr:beta-ketoacyl-ACP synthase II [Mycobacteriales bacterium]
MPVYITGIGAVTPVGDTAAETWRALLAGESGVRLLEEERYADLPVRIAAPLKTDPAERLDRVEARTLDRSQRVALVAAREAWADAGTPGVDPERLAVVVGTGIGGATTLLDQWDTLREKGPRRVSPFTVPMLMPNGPAAIVGLDIGARGPVRSTVSACASGADAIALAYDTIVAGLADVVVAGGTEACIHPLPLAGFAQMRALSTRHDDPAAASRPFDAERDGFVMGEGAGIVVLESAEHAARRGAAVYAELAGVGVTADAHHLTAPEPTGEGAARAMRLALAWAGLAPEEVGYVNAHATSTPVGDVAEAAAIRSVLGSVPVSATKSMTGHLLGAAGAVEAIVTALSVRDGVVHPTRNHDKPDERCDVDCVPEGARRVPLEAALSNSFGFGGHDVCLAFRRV